jgi:hypothetical protein
MTQSRCLATLCRYPTDTEAPQRVGPRSNQPPGLTDSGVAGLIISARVGGRVREFIALRRRSGLVGTNGRADPVSRSPCDVGRGPWRPSLRVGSARAWDERSPNPAPSQDEHGSRSRVLRVNERPDVHDTKRSEEHLALRRGTTIRQPIARATSRVLMDGSHDEAFVRRRCRRLGVRSARGPAETPRAAPTARVRSEDRGM